MDRKPIKRALISVYDKTGLEDLARALHDGGVQIVSTGSTASRIADAGVPVLGANLPMAQMRAAMADAQLDARLPGPALKAQQQAIRRGHCDLLPESQISPMTRIQVARDIRMARTIEQAALPGEGQIEMPGSSGSSHSGADSGGGAGGNQVRGGSGRSPGSRSPVKRRRCSRK